ncbi:MAG: nucleotidyl transferase AbiEii/AbiGii toxin family protein [Candidatus Aminicenantes bacterium]|jgi:hypothetical protein
MIGKKFLNAVANGQVDILQILLDILKKKKATYCVIGGLAVNAYVEPVVSLDLDVVIKSEDIEKVCSEAETGNLRVKRFEHSINLSSPQSDLRIQIQTDSRYQEFLSRSRSEEMLGYTMNVAAVEDVMQGKIWAYLDKSRRRSKRQKDLTDIMRLLESYPSLENRIPKTILDKML